MNFSPTSGDDSSDSRPAEADWDDELYWPGYEIALGLAEVDWCEPIEPLWAGA
jgi:hypothetical protein